MRSSVAVLLALAGCASSAPEAVSTVAPSAVASSGAKGSASLAAIAPGPKRSEDPRWIRAFGEDEAECVRLAEAVGAMELALGVEEGGDVGKTALRALPYAEDSDLALGRLAALARTAEASGQKAVLVAMLGIARRPRTQRELLDAQGVRAAGAVLVEISSRKDVDRDTRALAVSAARALAEKGYVDDKRIPRDLDPE